MRGAFYERIYAIDQPQGLIDGFLIERRNQRYKNSEIRLLRLSAPLRKGKRPFLFVSCIHLLLRRVRVHFVPFVCFLQLNIPYTLFFLLRIAFCHCCVAKSGSIKSYSPCQMSNR